MNKRGEYSSVLVTGEMLLLLLFVISAAIITVGLYRALNPSQQGNFESFRTLNEAVTNLLDSPETECWDHFLITSGNALTGFGKFKDQVTRVDILGFDFLDADEVLLRPEVKCPRDSSCLAMCDVSSLGDSTSVKTDCNGNRLLDIKTYQNVTDFKLTRETYHPHAANLAGLSDLIYFGDETNLEYFLLVKEGKSDAYTIVLARPNDIIGLDPIHNFKNCHNLKELTTKDQISQVTQIK